MPPYKIPQSLHANVRKALFKIISTHNFVRVLFASCLYEMEVRHTVAQCAEPDFNKTSNTFAETPTTFIFMA